MPESSFHGPSRIYSSEARVTNDSKLSDADVDGFCIRTAAGVGGKCTVALKHNMESESGDSVRTSVGTSAWHAEVVIIAAVIAVVDRYRTFQRFPAFGATRNDHANNRWHGSRGGCGRALRNFRRPESFQKKTTAVPSSLQHRHLPRRSGNPSRNLTLRPSVCSSPG